MTVTVDEGEKKGTAVHVAATKKRYRKCHNLPASNSKLYMNPLCSAAMMYMSMREAAAKKHMSDSSRKSCSSSKPWNTSLTPTAKNNTHMDSGV